MAGESDVSEVLCAPGNAGIDGVARIANVSASDPAALATLAERERIDLTIVGPELPLDLGIADLFLSRGLPLFGPSRAAAQLECSKVFAKQFMARHGIPTARYRVCDDAASALAAIASGELGFPIVVKADGLAAGKGVVVAPDRATAEGAVRAAMEERQFGDAGSRLVLEECKLEVEDVGGIAAGLTGGEAGEVRRRTAEGHLQPAPFRLGRPRGTGLHASRSGQPQDGAARQARRGGAALVAAGADWGL